MPRADKPNRYSPELTRVIKLAEFDEGELVTIKPGIGGRQVAHFKFNQPHNVQDFKNRILRKGRNLVDAFENRTITNVVVTLKKKI